MSRFNFRVAACMVALLCVPSMTDSSEVQVLYPA